MTELSDLSARSLATKKRSHSDSELSCHLEFDRLRQLLFDDEQQSLKDLSDRINSKERRAEDVSEVLADSFRRTADAQTLVSAMAPSFAKSFSECVNSDPELIADAVSPIIGPAIRQSISRALQAMMQSTNQAMEMSFSPQGLRWRLEAYRTGKPFAEVVLLHTLLFRVKQIFLIHRKTGLLLHHVSSNDEGGADSDMVSGMLTAIQDFVNDSFGQQNSNLDSVRVGENTIWLDCEQQTVLAAVIEGEPPESLRVTLEEAHEAITRQLGREINEFSGDTSKFVQSEVHLQPCLLTQTKQVAGKKKKPPIASIACAVFGLILASVFGWWWYSSSQHQSAIAQRELAWTETIAKVEAEPGIAVTRFGESDGQFYLFAMRDAFARLPQDVLAGLPINSGEIEQHWTSYLSTDRPIVAARVRNTLRVPATVKQSANKDGIVLIGTASNAWIDRAKRIVDDGIFSVSIDLSGVVNLDAPWLDYVAMLSDLEVVNVERSSIDGKTYTIEGAYDSNSEHPDSLLPPEISLERVKSKWRKLDITTSTLQEARIIRLLDPPSTCAICLDQGCLQVNGIAPAIWIERFEALAPNLQGIERIDSASLVNEDAGFEDFVAHLQSTPGYVVISAKRVGDRYLIEGLRDPAASQIPKFDEDLLAKIDRRWKPFVDTSDVMEQRRIQQQLDPPATVEVKFSEGQLTVVGKAHHWWIDTLTEYANRSVAIKQVDFAGLVDIELRSYQKFKSKIQSIAIPFQANQYKVSSLSKRERDTLYEVAICFRRLIELGQHLDKQIHLVIAGQAAIAINGNANAADGTAYAKRLGKVRANSIGSELVSTGISRNKLKTKGHESPRGKSRRSHDSGNNRSVTFTIAEI